MNPNTKKFLAIGGLIVAVSAAGYAAYYYLLGAGSAAGKKKKQDEIKALNIKALEDAKVAAAAKQKLNTTQKANPTDPVIDTLKAQVAQLLKQASSSKDAAQKAGGGGASGGGGSSAGGNKASGDKKTNADGSKVKPSEKLDEFGNPKGSTVDSDGHYIEKGDPTTLYDKSGKAVGDLDPVTGMFRDENGKVIAASDGSMVSDYDDTTGVYTEASSGQQYSGAGVPISYDKEAGTYIEADDPTTLYSKEGEAIGDLNPQTGAFENENGYPIATADGAEITAFDSNGNYQEADGTWYSSAGDPIDASQIDTYIDNADGTLHSPDGDVIGEYNAETGNFENADGDPIATADGTDIAAYDGQGNYQEPDGQWYSSSGDPIDASQVDDTDIAYNDGYEPASE